MIAAMLTVGLGDLGGLVQRLFIALLFGAPVGLGLPAADGRGYRGAGR